MKPSRGGLAMLLLTAAACGGGGAAAPTVASAPVPPQHAAVGIAVAPAPIASATTAPGDPSAPRLAVWTLTITESAGVGATLNFVNETLRDAQSGAVADPGGEASLGASDIVTLAGAVRLPPRGTLTLPCQLVYGLPDGSVGGRLTLTLQLTDDTGQLVSASVSVPVD